MQYCEAIHYSNSILAVQQASHLTKIITNTINQLSKLEIQISKPTFYLLITLRVN